ncbi:hypothetical protein LS70_009240 [Helicobacter sp. MIT 11-5569]|uniref:hypothetical protein n=1 Tax=Helicobacter sp. MIT 11-5569 TaxID=1548151 RepID=UPI00051FAB4B|nr:hypothetical protein [Helicobacter sp. MIT 11-5569]TLD80354.1 hypothetical protein LS70_009240 [Helicobacter sp. MIT 11-5569]
MKKILALFILWLNVCVYANSEDSNPNFKQSETCKKYSSYKLDGHYYKLSKQEVIKEIQALGISYVFGFDI